MKSKTAIFIILSIFSLFFILTTHSANAQTVRNLGGVRLQSCQARESAVKNRMESLIDLVTNMESKFDSIAMRVENFYTNKIVPSGKTVSNYDTLVSTIGTKKDAVTAALDKAKGDVSAFSCTANDPKGLLNQFRLDMQAVKGALKDYRTSIKNLIVAVHSVSPSESPSASPEVTK